MQGAAWISGEQNTYYSDYIEFLALLYTQLLPLLRGHHAEEEIKPIFLKAHQCIKSATNQPVNPPTNPPTFKPPSNAWTPPWRHLKENCPPTRQKAMPQIWKTSWQLFTNHCLLQAQEYRRHCYQCQATPLRVFPCSQTVWISLSLTKRHHR